MNATTAPTQGGGFFGHPRGLSTLFFTEMWERFSYYGMKAMLFLFVTAAIIEGPQSGLGIGAEVGGAISGLYNSFVYLLALPGGWIADRVIGQRKAVLIGAIVIACGHFSMAIPGVTHAMGIEGGGLFFFYTGLVLIVIGTGLLKPNISTMVGELYEGDMGARRDAGFSIFYMGINIGAWIAPLACGWVRGMWGWHFGFGLAGIGMTLGVIWYIVDGKHLGQAGMEPKIAPAELPRAKRQAIGGGIAALLLIAVLTLLHKTGLVTLTWIGMADFLGYAILALVAVFIGYVAFFTGQDTASKKKVLVIGILFLYTAMFWSGFEQASTSLNAFGRDMTARVFGGWEMPPEFTQSINPLFIIILAPFFGALWIRLSSKNLNPNIPLKFALGLLQLSLGFFVIMFAASQADRIPGVVGDPAKGASIAWLSLMYLLFTTGELCLSPIGLSTITKLAPKAFVSQMMGIWFIASALGNLIAGRVGGQIEDKAHHEVFFIVASIVGATGLVALLLSPVIQRKMMGNVR